MREISQTQVMYTLAPWTMILHEIPNCCAVQLVTNLTPDIYVIGENKRRKEYGETGPLTFWDVLSQAYRTALTNWRAWMKRRGRAPAYWVALSENTQSALIEEARKTPEHFEELLITPSKEGDYNVVFFKMKFHEIVEYKPD